MGTLVGTFYCVMGTSFIDGWMETVTFELMRRYTCVYRKIFFEIVSSERLASQYWITLLLGPITMSWIWDSGSVWSKPKNVILSDSVHVIVCLQHFLLFLIRVGRSFTRWSGPLAAIWSLPTNIDGPVHCSVLQVCFDTWHMAVQGLLKLHCRVQLIILRRAVPLCSPPLRVLLLNLQMLCSTKHSNNAICLLSRLALVQEF